MPEEQEVPLHRERLNLPDKNAGQKINEAKRKQLRQDMAFCFGTVQGRNVLRFMMGICGYRKSKVGGNVNLGMSIEQGTLYNASRELIFIEVAEHIPSDILKDAEYGVDEDLGL